MGNTFFMGVAALAAAGSVFGADRLSATEKGSLLIYSNAEGTLHISNDYQPTSSFKLTSSTCTAATATTWASR